MEDLGQPEEKRIRQACGKAKQVKIYSYQDRQAKTWLALIEGKLARFEHLQISQLPSEQMEALTALVNKNMSLQISVQDGEVFVSSADGQVTVTPARLFPAA
jgi:Uncharacterized protein conserved in bacteria